MYALLKSNKKKQNYGPTIRAGPAFSSFGVSVQQASFSVSLLSFSRFCPRSHSARIGSDSTPSAASPYCIDFSEKYRGGVKKPPEKSWKLARGVTSALCSAGEVFCFKVCDIIRIKKPPCFMDTAFLPAFS